MLRQLSTALLAASLAGATTTGLRLATLEGGHVDPFASPPGTRAIVFVFVSVDCPISNRYAPELRRLHDRFATRGVVFRLVYPNPTESTDAIQTHVSEYRYAAQPLRDPRHELVTLAKAGVTPEAAVFDAAGRLLYRGRIDDRYLAVGLERPHPARRDLEEALVATLAGRPVTPASGPAIGCFIADLVQ